MMGGGAEGGRQWTIAQTSVTRSKMSSREDEQYYNRRISTAASFASWFSMAGIASVGVGVALYLYSMHTGKKSTDLDRVHDVTNLSITDLRKLVLPALVAIRGRVNSHAPKKCDLCDKHAVIHEVVEEEVWRKQRAEGRTVYEPYETRKVFEECEWFLEDGSGVRVKVENALQADRLRTAMEFKTEFTGEDLSKVSLSKLIVDKAWQTTKHGMRKTERYLPVDAVVTCVGELNPNYIHSTSSTSTRAKLGSGTSNTTASSVRQSHLAMSSPAADLLDGGSTAVVKGWNSVLAPLSGGTGAVGQGLSSASGAVPLNEDMPYVLRKPTAGPCYITPLTLGQLRAAMSSTARNCRWLAYIFGAVGAALIVRKVVVRLWQRARERRIRQRVLQAEAQRKQRQAEARRRAAGASIATGGPDWFAGERAEGSDEDEEGYSGDRPEGTCVICLEDRVDMVFTACGHLCCCMGCGLGLDRCPICRLKSRAIKVYKP